MNMWITPYICIFQVPIWVRITAKHDDIWNLLSYTVCDCGVHIYTLHDIHRCIEIDRCSNSNDLYSDLLSLPMRFLIDSIIFFPFFPLFPPTPLNNKWLNQLTITQLTNWRTQWSKKFPYFFYPNENHI